MLQMGRLERPFGSRSGTAWRLERPKRRGDFRDWVTEGRRDGGTEGRRSEVDLSELSDPSAPLRDRMATLATGRTKRLRVEGQRSEVEGRRSKVRGRRST